MTPSWGMWRGQQDYSQMLLMPVKIFLLTGFFFSSFSFLLKPRFSEASVVSVSPMTDLLAVLEGNEPLGQRSNSHASRHRSYVTLTMDYRWGEQEEQELISHTCLVT